MKKSLAFLSAALLLTSCGGPQTVAFGSATLTYDSGRWEPFSNELATGLGVKGNESCWVDLAGDLTTPRVDEELVKVTDGAISLYSNPSDGTTQYVSFVVGSETVYGRVSIESSDSCVGELMGLASGTLGE
jgi:hypothetical protein